MLGLYGADAMRWALLSSPVMRGGDLVVEQKAMAEAVRGVINPLWNSWKFFAMYANADGCRAGWRTDAADVLDRYVISKARVLVEDVTGAMDRYDLYGACNAVTGFLDALNNWYIRRSRDRFWSPVGTSRSSDQSKADAYDTLYTVLHVLCRAAAPLLPMVSEVVFQGLTGQRSVHVADWPSAAGLPGDADLVAAMDRVRDVCSAGHSVRKARELRARLPLGSVTVSGQGSALLAPYAELLKDELNVKKVVLSEEVGEAADLVLQVNPAVLGPRLGPATQDVITAARRGEWTRTAEGGVQVAGRALNADEYSLSLLPRDKDASRALPGNGAVVTLDLEVSRELEGEGLARDVVRRVQEARKNAGLDVSDRIRLVLGLAHLPDLHEAVEAHRGFIGRETLASEVVVVSGPVAGGSRAELADGRAFEIGVARLP
jgi:isoleucyl-tRNA synthetase